MRNRIRIWWLRPRGLSDPELLLAVAEVFPHDLGQQLWWESYQRRTPKLRRDLIADLRRRQARNRLADGSSRQG